MAGICPAHQIQNRFKAHHRSDKAADHHPESVWRRQTVGGSQPVFLEAHQSWLKRWILPDTGQK